MTSYKPIAAERCRDLDVRGLRVRIHCWGDAQAPLILLLHGWADTGASFQLLADHMHRDWQLLAPDWRGFGDSDRAPGGYWFPDYLADLDTLLDQLSPHEPVRIAGHSMGGNVAWLYAGTRPERLSHVASLDAFGLPDGAPDSAPDRYRQWLDELRGHDPFSEYASMAALTARVLKLAPQMDPATAEFIARQWSRTAPDGRLQLRHDPAHKRVNPVLYRRAEALACWRRITARNLLVLGGRSRFHAAWFQQGGRGECRAAMPALNEAVLDCGHMLHLEEPRALAKLLGDFFGSAGGV